MKKQTKIAVQEYDPEWEKEFNKLKNVYVEQLQGLFLSIEHVGSTSVKGLSAKPIIDIDIVIEKESNKNYIINKLAELGYIHRGDLGIVGREAFRRQTPKVPFVDSQEVWMNHHLYLCSENSISLLNHLKFRDYLRANDDARTEYGNLKKHLSAKFAYDIDSYIEGKSGFILKILEELDFNIDDLEDIEQQNKSK